MTTIKAGTVTQTIDGIPVYVDRDLRAKTPCEVDRPTCETCGDRHTCFGCRLAAEIFHYEEEP